MYYYKDKTSRSPKDLICLSTFDVNQVYYGVGWKKKFKAPTEHCFAVKHPCLQQPKSTKYVKYVCAEDEVTLQRWMSAIRIVKYGQQLVENYETALAGGGPMRTSPSSCSVGTGVTGPTSSDMMMQLMDDIESGLSSDSGGSSSGCDVAFESDYPPCGTIKRKPPKLPLTATTRQLTCSVVETSVAAAAAAAASVSAVGAQQQPQQPQQKPVKTVKFAVDHHFPVHHHHHHHSPQQRYHRQRTPSLESLPPPPPPELLTADDCGGDEPDDVDIMSVVPPPPPKLLSPPSTAFLADLHRVVSKKWTVAQKCKLDARATPHEVLGFRDPVQDQRGVAYSREANVSNWVAEHYGPNNLYENVVCPVNGGGTSPTALSTRRCSSPSPPPPPPPPPGRITLPTAVNAAMACAVLKNKRPPPPPPPRSDKTQLSTVVS